MEEFIKKRVAAVIAENGISERQLSIAIGHSDSYINKSMNGEWVLV